MLMIVVTTLLALLYGLAWHDEPANEPPSEQRSNELTRLARHL